MNLNVLMHCNGSSVARFLIFDILAMIVTFVALRRSLAVTKSRSRRGSSILTVYGPRVLAECSMSEAFVGYGREGQLHASRIIAVEFFVNFCQSKTSAYGEPVRFTSKPCTNPAYLPRSTRRGAAWIRIQSHANWSAQVAMLQEELAKMGVCLEEAVHGRSAAKDIADRLTTEVQDLRNCAAAAEAGLGKVCAKATACDCCPALAASSRTLQR